MAGAAATPPFHFAHFLPEDEGVEGSTTKTVVYRNIYLLRFLNISLPLISMDEIGLDIGSVRAGASRVLVRWMRAHDVAHSYFDQICMTSGLGGRTLHGIREVLADVFANALLLGSRTGCGRTDSDPRRDATLSEARSDLSPPMPGLPEWRSPGWNGY